MPAQSTPYYVTTPIYYVNDRPHIGHCYTTLVADVAARAQRLIGRPVFFLTGTDEHAEKVVTSAREHDMSPMQWATLNAERFKEAFAFMNFSNDDFVRTTEDRHTTRAAAYIQRLIDSGDIELGDYVGWFDPSQEEYVTETAAKEHDYKSPVTGKPLEKRTEQNYFFRLDKHEAWLKDQIESGAVRVLPDARKNEVLGRIKGGLQKVPVSRKIKEGDADWGIAMPGDPDHRIYVWIEALCNYLTTMDTDERRRFWPPLDEAGGAGSPPLREEGGPPQIVHLMAKDILWFHAVIWPAMLRALGERPPSVVYAHAYWISEGTKMSKSLGNFIEIDQLRAYADKYSLDAVRWFLMTQGPLGATDADFAHHRFIEVYNANLANGIGNATSRVGNMIAKYFEGEVPNWADFSADDHPKLGDANDTFDLSESIRGESLQEIVRAYVREVQPEVDSLDLASFSERGVGIVRAVDGYITRLRPFEYAKMLKIVEGHDLRWVNLCLGTMMYEAGEALRIASLLFAPIMPEKMAEVWRNWSCDHLNDPSDANSGFVAPLSKLAEWGGDYSLKPGQKITKGEALFMRADPSDPAPGS